MMADCRPRRKKPPTVRGSECRTALLVLGVLAAGCALALLAFRNVPRHPAVAPTQFGWQALFGRPNVALKSPLYG
jgi:hypothetical protein